MLPRLVSPDFRFSFFTEDFSFSGSDFFRAPLETLRSPSFVFVVLFSPTVVDFSPVRGFVVFFTRTVADLFSPRTLVVLVALRLSGVDVVTVLLLTTVEERGV